MGYLNDADRWLDAQFEALSKGALEYAEVKQNIRERILESYRNGLAAAGQSPAPKRSTRRGFKPNFRRNDG